MRGRKHVAGAVLGVLVCMATAPASSSTLEAEEASLRAQMVVLDEQAVAARSELARSQQAARELADQAGRTSRRGADIRSTLAERVSGDEANYQRWAADIQSDIRDLDQRIAATSYLDEKLRRQSEIDRLAAEQARLLDTSRRWQEKLTRFASQDLDATTRELQQVTDRLAAARAEEARLSGKVLEASATAQELARKLSAVQQLRTLGAAP